MNKAEKFYVHFMEEDNSEIPPVDFKESFLQDWKDYGRDVAIYNIGFLMGHKSHKDRARLVERKTRLA